MVPSTSPIPQTLCDGLLRWASPAFTTVQRSTTIKTVDKDGRRNIERDKGRPICRKDHEHDVKGILLVLIPTLWTIWHKKNQGERPGLAKKVPCFTKTTPTVTKMSGWLPKFINLAFFHLRLFPSLKKFLAGKMYGSDSEVIAARNCYFVYLDEEPTKEESNQSKCISSTYSLCFRF